MSALAVVSALTGLNLLMSYVVFHVFVGWTSLHVACDFRNSSAYDDLIIYLIREARADPDGELSLSLSYHSNKSSSAYSTGFDHNGETALHRACTRGDESVVKLLLSLGASVSRCISFSGHSAHARVHARAHLMLIYALAHGILLIFHAHVLSR